MGGFMMLGLKYTHKSKKAPENPLKLNADRESAILERSIPYLLKNVYNLYKIDNTYVQGVYK
jgi:hypothetical protein